MILPEHYFTISSVLMRYVYELSLCKLCTKAKSTSFKKKPSIWLNGNQEYRNRRREKECEIDRWWLDRREAKEEIVILSKKHIYLIILYLI